MTDENTQPKPFKDASPDEVREQTQQKVGGMVSKATGAMSTATDRMDKGSRKTTEALHKTGETTRDVGKVAVEETRKTKEQVGSGGQS